MPVRDPDAAECWRATFAGWRRSGLSALSFCRSRSIDTSSFYRCRNLLEPLDPPKPSPAFVPLRVVPESLVDATLPNGVQLRIPLAADVDRVARLARALGAEPC